MVAYLCLDVLAKGFTARFLWCLLMNFGHLSFVDMRSAMPQNFFAEFERHHAAHARILADRALRQEIPRIRNCSNIPYTLLEGLREPKPELVEYDCGPVEYMYRVRTLPKRRNYYVS
jgi:hypothetical protein